MANSIKENGVLEPIIVRQNAKGYEIVAGERRFRASQLAKLVTIPAVIREVSDEDILKLQIVENVQRENVQYMEEAYGLLRLRDECSYDVAEIAKAIGKSDTYVTYMLALAAMASDARRIAENGWLSKSVAWQIARIPDEDNQVKAANDLGRTARDKWVNDRTARKYLEDSLGDARASRIRRTGIQKMSGNDFTANWKYYLLRFNCDQFEAFKKSARGRTETAILAEAVESVMISE